MTKGIKRASSWDQASSLSRCCLAFFYPLMVTGYRDQITLTNLARQFPVSNGDKSHKLGPKLANIYYARPDKRPSFLWAIIRAFWVELLLITFIDLIAKCVGCPIQTILLGFLVQNISLYSALSHKLASGEPTNSSQPPDNSTISTLEMDSIYSNMLYQAIGLLGCTWLIGLLGHLFLLYSYRLGMKCRIAACHMIYQKSLRLSQSTLAEHTTTGQMINLLSNDVNRFDDAVQMGPSLLAAPIQVATLLTLMFRLYHGSQATLASWSIIVGFLLIQASLGVGFFRFRRLMARRTDERVRLINEILESIRMIKIYAWEKPFELLVGRSRKSELKIIGVTSMLKAINQTLFFMASKVIVFAALIAYVYSGRKLNPEVVAATIFQANLIRMSLTFFFPNAIASYAEVFVSCSRINKFLNLPEIRDKRARRRSTPEHIRVSMRQVYATRSHRPDVCSRLDLNAFPVRNLSLQVESRDLLIAVGRVGSGKSSVLLSLLGEICVEHGDIELFGRVSYAPQEPWIFSASIRDNITLGRSTDSSSRYEQAVSACLLDLDFHSFPAGDQTQLDGSCSMLSHNQAARVGLARAIYQDADIYILDSPLSTLTLSMANHIFDEAILKFLAGKTVIMGTNQLQFLKHATKVLVLDRDLEPVFGTLEQVKTSATFSRLLHYANLSDQQVSTIKPEADPNVRTDCRPAVPRDDEFGVDVLQQTSRRNKLELMQNLSMNLRSYVFYVAQAANSLGLVWFVLTNIAAQALFQYTDVFLSWWADSVQRKENEGPNFEPRLFVDELTVGDSSRHYAIIVGSCALSAFARALTFYLGSLLASLRIHRKLFASIMNTPMRFFDFRPMGMLMNRVSRDTGYVDDTLPTIMLDLVSTLVSVIGVLILASVIDFLNLLPSILFLIVTLVVRSLCAATIIRLKQVEGIARSPIFSLVSSTRLGLASIRVFDLTDMFSRQFDSLQDVHTSAWFAFICSGRFLSLWLDFLVLVFVTFVIGLKVGFTFDMGIPSLIGLTLTQMLLLPTRVQWGSRQLVELESQMTSVQRIEEFSSLQPEASPTTLESALDTTGGARIDFLRVSLAYVGGDNASLVDLSFSIKPGERIGVVGQTGSGKSSLISVLLRLYPFEGSIRINGEDTKHLSLNHLRSSIDVVPQEPVLFARSLRKNLDPFDKHSDFDIWSAIDAVELMPLVASSAQGLNLEIQELGANLSVGQRQLICLARAILRRNKILILDEATASVDPETDASIQRTIRREFSGCTVVTIAHRLSTIVNSDRVLVLDHGRLREFDDPIRLVHDENSAMSRMLGRLDEHQAETLKRSFREAKEANKGV